MRREFKSRVKVDPSANGPENSASLIEFQIFLWMRSPCLEQLGAIASQLTLTPTLARG
jgi:hypothetical protein